MPLAPPMFPQSAPAGPASPPTGNPGLAATAASKVREAIMILEKALPELPIGSEMHDAAVKALGPLAKAFPVTDQMPGIQNATLMGLQRQAKEGAMMQQLMQQMGGAGGGGGGPPPPGAPPGGAPQMPPPTGGM